MNLPRSCKLLAMVLPLAALAAGAIWLSAHSRKCLPEDLAIGESIYRLGISGDGQALQGVTQGDLAFADPKFNCEQCHRRSGFGSSEGGTYVLPVTGNTLFNPRNFERSDLFNKLFKESQDPRFWTRMRSAYQRPAYDHISLARAIRDGVDPSGRTLSPSMPRYRLGDADMKALIAYLRQLSTGNDPGVDEKAVYLATVVDGRVNAADRRAMLSTITEFVEWLNLETQGNLDHPNFSPGYRSEFAKAFRLWRHEVWELPENPEQWQRYLLDRYRQQPVFAFIGGMVEGDWTPIHQFCEANRVPCLFPVTELPPDGLPSHYSMYFNQGLLLEAKVIGRHLKTQNAATETLVVNLHGSDQGGSIPAKALAQTLADQPQIQVQDITIDSRRPLQEQLPLRQDGMAAPFELAIWPGKDAGHILKALPQVAKHVAHIWLPSSLLKADWETIGTETLAKIYFSYPYELPDTYHPHAFRIRSWMNTRDLPIDDQNLQFNTYYALNLLQFGLEHVIDHFSRDYLLEFIEREAENNLNPGTFPRLSLGPGQRFASKGAYIVQLDHRSPEKLRAVTEWLIP